MIGGFLIGLLGSLHCVGMCGPVMLLFGQASQRTDRVFLYHFGRVSSYLLIGVVLGSIGSFAVLLQVQQVAVLVLGLAILLVYGIPSLRNRLERWYYQSDFYQSIRKTISSNLSRRNRWLVSGIANGFFPCGMTYIAAAGAIAMANWWQGGVFMLSFGLGTLPALLVLQYSGAFFMKRFKAHIAKSLQVVAFLSGVLMMYRGTVMSFPHFENAVKEATMGLMTICGF